ncbi:type II and III secretion system protein family protein [Cucumibacter marinus]|uniref:type II and III secretion system protein family protein n=1 Tax=Cucumibacter marinus TaxID=1121252 RepID=UPI00041B409A|nr:type II and III secretion system protein family protein [Cucumibacter marinus]
MKMRIPSISSLIRPLLRPARGTLAALILGLSATGIVATVPAEASSSHLRVANTGGQHRVDVPLNKSVIIDLPVSAQEVIVSQPQVAGAIMRSKRRAILQGNSIGETNVFFLDGAGNTIAVVDVSVGQDATGLAATIQRLVPGVQVRVDTFDNRIVLSGRARTTNDESQAIKIAAQFAGSEDNVVSVISVDGSQQVMLKVMVAEVSREAIRQLGINLDASVNAGALTTGLVSTPGLGGASNVVTSNALSANLGIGNFTLEATLKALERNGAVRTLASPTLTAKSGEEAEFLAGGEFPVPTGVDGNDILFEFKEFGVKLKFAPVVETNNMISLEVDTSVSEPTTEGGFSAGALTIPATKERRAKTSVQVPSGGTLAIAGMFQDKVRQQLNQLPGIGRIPILGALFRSRDFVHSQTELLILVTPYLTEPGRREDFTLPTEQVQLAGDAEAAFLGHIESVYGIEGTKSGVYQGQVGFVLD